MNMFIDAAPAGAVPPFVDVRRFVTRGCAPLLLALALSGCASFSADGGFASVERSVRERLDKEVHWERSAQDRQAVARRTAELLAAPLTADSAVQIALFENRGLQAAFFELGIGEADLVAAGRWPNPGISLARLRRGDELEIERGLHLNLARLLALPLTSRIESQRFAQTQRAVAAQALSLAAQVRKAFYQAVAAGELLRYLRQVLDAAEASAELARRMAQVGNWNRLRQAREHGFYAEAALALARAEQHHQAAREHLTRLMGLWGSDLKFTLPERLPDLPAQADELPQIEREAMTSRLDLQIARSDVERLASNLGLTRRTRLINVLELGVVRNSSNEAPTQRGYEIAFELPLFDWGGARVAKAQALYMQAVHRAAQTAIDARSEVRQAYAAYRSGYEVARHYRDEIVPIRKRISEENLLRYNGMLIGVFELLADARAQILGVTGYIDALRDFWVTHADLELALVGKPSLTAAAGTIDVSTAAAATDAGGAH